MISKESSVDQCSLSTLVALLCDWRGRTLRIGGAVSDRDRSKDGGADSYRDLESSQQRSFSLNLEEVQWCCNSMGRRDVSFGHHPGTV
jgi:hypothetical protein